MINIDFMYKNFFKRVLDFFIALIALLILFPFLAIVTIWLHFANKGAGAFFFQKRPGKDAKIFKVIKYKTMTDERDKDGKLLPDSQRLTRVGRFVRSCSLDELPQLLNVIRGDMSIIGPRPLLPIYILVLDDYQKRRHEVRPGITGWAQVNGRNHCKLSKKFEYDVWYVDHCSLFTDIKIIILTIINIIKKTDIGEGTGDMKNIDDIGMIDRIHQIEKEKGIKYE